MTREPSDIEEDKAEWERDICDELEEMQEQADEEYQKKLEKYEQDMKLWKEQKLQKVNITYSFNFKVDRMQVNITGNSETSK